VDHGELRPGQLRQRLDHRTELPPHGAAGGTDDLHTSFVNDLKADNISLL
jgi:hypothetical protein